MTDRKAFPKNGFRSINTPGGSKPGKIQLDWINDPEGRLIKIAAQRIMDNHDMDNWRTRNFGGRDNMKPLLAVLPKATPRFYKLLYNHCDGNNKRMLNIIYDRGHKGCYENSEERGLARARKGKEHYSISKKLKPYVEEAKIVFKGLI